MYIPPYDCELVSFATLALQSSDFQKFLNKNKKYWNAHKDKINSTTNYSREKLWLIINNISFVECKMCCNHVKWNHRYAKYQTYCSIQCANKDPDKQIKQTNTMNDRYGGFGFQSPNVNKKIKQTMLQQYGVECATQSPTFQEKIIQTNLKKYGVKRPAQNIELLQKTKITNNKKWGVDWVPQNGEIRQKQKDTLEKNYGVTIPMLSDVIKQKQKITQKNNAEQSCYSSQQKVPKQSLILLQDKQFLHNQHIVEQNSLVQISKQLNVDAETVRQRMIKFNIPVQRFFHSVGEREIYDFLLTLNIPNVLQNIRSIISPYEIDLYIPDHKIAIEYCGLYWHSEQAGKDKWYHYNKWKRCNDIGIKLITIFEDEWTQQQDLIKQKLVYFLHLSNKKCNARSCKIEIIDTGQAKNFLDTYHIQQNKQGGIYLSLQYENIIVAVMVFTKTQKGYYLERYATSINVVGGFSKLLSYFTKNFDYDEIITFADLRWSEGKLYELAGFKLNKILPPDYYYSPDGIYRYHKSNFRRKYLGSKLENFDENLTEKQNCDNNDILRIWDCGKLRYVYTKH